MKKDKIIQTNELKSVRMHVIRLTELFYIKIGNSHYSLFASLFTIILNFLNLRKYIKENPIF